MCTDNLPYAIRPVSGSMPEICKSASSGTRLVTWAQRITESVLSWRGAGVLRDRDDDYGNERLVPQQAMSPGIQT